jgi:hypothetical protein
MQQTMTANQLQGRAIGALFFTGFGSLWLLLALAARQQLTVAHAAPLAACALLLTLASLGLKRMGARFPRVADDPAMGRAFGWINAVQWIAVFAVAFGFSRMHWDAYTPSAITAIVGLHMFPLARLFRYPLHNLTGIVLTAWAIASLYVAPSGALQSTTALGTGALLWTSAALTLALGFRVVAGSKRALAV